MKIKLTAHIHYRKYPWEEKGEFQLWHAAFPDEDSRTYIGEQEVEIEVPDNYDPRPAQIAALIAQKQKVMGDYQKTVTEINNRISNLQALEYTA